MAKGKLTPQQQQAALDAEFKSLAPIANEWAKILEKKKAGRKFDEERLKQLEEEYKSYNRLSNKVDKIGDSFNDLNDKIKEFNDDLDDTLSDFDDLDDSFTSIGKTIGKNSKLYEAFQSKVDDTKTTIKSVSAILQKSNTLSVHQVDNAKEAAKAYTSLNTNVLDATKQLSKGNITQSEFNDLVKDSFKHFDSLVDKIDDSTEAGKALIQTFKDARAAAEGFEKAAEKSEKRLKAMSTAMGQFEGVPMMKEFGGVVESAAQGGKGLGMALFAAGAAAGALAYELGFVGDKLGTVAKYDKKLVGLNAQIDLIKENIKGGFASEEALGAFGFELQRMAVEFEKASKTALFGKGLGSVGYGAAELQLAGVSAETIAEAMTAASNATGKMPIGKVGADMSILAKRTGQSSENIAEVNDLFQRLDKVSEKTALNMQEGVRAMASKAGISLGAAMTEISNASKDALSYQIKSASALAKQVIFAKSMGVSFNDIAKAGQNMVLNYKDSIKAEMQLSSMLGEQVDLSEVRAKFAAGDTSGAIESLKAQGLNPEDMDMFQQQALQQATGMSLTDLQKISTRTGNTGGNLAAGNAGAANSGYLSTIKNAEAASKVANANIDVAQAKFNIKTSAEIESAIQDAIIKNTDGIKDLMNQTKREETKKTAETAAGAGTAGLVGGGVTALLGLGAQKLAGKGLTNIFSKIAPKIGTSVAEGVAGAGEGAAVAGEGAAAAGGSMSAAAIAPIAAAAAGIWAAGKGAYNVASSEALNSGKGGAMQTAGNVISGIGAEFVNVLDKISFGGTKYLAEKAGVSVRGVDTSSMEQARAAYRQQTGQQIGMGEEGNQKLVDWVEQNKAYLSGKGGLDSTVKAFEQALAEGKIKTSGATVAGTPAAVPPGGTSVAANPTDINKILERIATSTNNTVIDLNSLYTKTSQVGNNLITNGNTQIAELRILNTNTAALKELTLRIEALTRATYEGGTKVMIDGKVLANASTKYTDNTKGSNPTAEKITTGY